MITRIQTTWLGAGPRTIIAAGLAAWAVLTMAGDLDDVPGMIHQARYGEALDQIERYLRRHPGDPQARFLKGVALAEQALIEPAIEVFEALTTDYPSLPEPHNNLAVLYAAHGKYDKAREALLVAIEADPGYATAHENLGDVYAQMASVAYDRSIELHAANPTARAKLSALRAIFAEPASRAPEPDAVAVTTAGVVTQTSAEELLAVTIPPLTAVPQTAITDVEATETEQREAVLDVVQAWARAWSNQDVTSYLELYGDAFEPPGGLSRHRWEEQRRQRLRAPRFIEIELSELELQWPEGDRATVVFFQGYRSDTFQDRVRKELQLARSADAWKIVGERSLR